MRNHGRAEGQTQVSISLPEELLKKIQLLADADGRNRSNMIVHLLRQEIEAHERDMAALKAMRDEPMRDEAPRQKKAKKDGGSAAAA